MVSLDFIDQSEAAIYQAGVLGGGKIDKQIYKFKYIQPFTEAVTRGYFDMNKGVIVSDQTTNLDKVTF